MRLAQVHCARFDMLRHIPLFRRLLAAEQQRHPGEELWVLDPMAGVCTIHAIAMPGVVTFANEIEAPYVEIGRQLYPGCESAVGDAADLAFEDEIFDAVIVSPDFGNRYADHHNACDGSTRRSYTHDLRHLTGDPSYQLDPRSSARHRATRREYWDRQICYWTEAYRVLSKGGLMVLDVKDGVEAKRTVEVVSGHRDILLDVGFAIETEMPLPAPGFRYGENNELRHDGHTVIMARKPTL